MSCTSSSARLMSAGGSRSASKGFIAPCFPPGGSGNRRAERCAMMAAMDLGIDGRTAVVTGATRGIGAAVAALLEEEGARVVSVARSEGIDVTAADAADRIADRAGGPVDILVNNAGTSRIAGLDEMEDEDFYDAF